jgi:signal transduction histidine kinase
VLNVGDQELDWKFEGMVKKREAFLKKTDLIYGITEGKYLDTIVNDDSLKDMDDVDACVTIYKRILLPILGKIHTNRQFRESLSKHPVTQKLIVTKYGEISVKRVKQWLLNIPKKQRLSLIIDGFNTLLSSVYEQMLMNDNFDGEEVLAKLRLVLTLNREKAVDLGIYPTLLGMLATKIPKTQVHRLYSDYLEELVEERTQKLRETQDTLLKSQRLAAIGEVAAMVGHDLRNPLQAIVNTLYLTRRTIKERSNGDVQELLETINEQVEYMNKIVSDLQDYARPVNPKIVEIYFQEFINNMLESMIIPSNISVSTIMDENVSTLMVDPMLMKRVLSNLITNALQAMPQGGKLMISLRKTGENALIRIQDTGIGIPEENLDLIFSPLFTTKSKGQGLGLAVCKRLVEAHKGSITVESEPDQGSTFTIHIPLERDVKTAVVQA